MTFVGQSSPQGRTRYQVQDVGRIVAIIFSGIFWSAVAYGCFYYLDQYKLFYANGDGWTTAAHSFNLIIHYGFVLNDLPKELLPLLAVGILIVATLFAVRAVFRLAANFRGIVVDFDRGSISYSGGGVIRNTFGDLFRLRFMFQTCYRFETPLDQIRMIEPRNLRVTRQGGSGFAGGVAGEFFLRDRPSVKRTPIVTISWTSTVASEP